MTERIAMRTRLVALGGAFLVAALALALALAAPAQARGRLLGLVPRLHPAPLAAAAPRVAAPAAPASGSVAYQGGPVMHSSQTFVIFWDPGHLLGDDFKARVERFLTDVGQDSGTAANVYGVPTEYTDASGNVAYRTSFGGAYTDTSPIPMMSSCAQGGLNLFTAPCLTDAAIQAEIAAVLKATNWRGGLDRAYFLLTPSNVEACQDTASGLCSTNAFCAYHSQLDPAAYPAYPDANAVVYGYIPWDAVSGCAVPESPNGSDADSTVNLISHEHIEMLTDPLVGQPAWTNADGTEIADKCRTSYAPVSGAAGAGYNQTINGDRYILQGEWSNARGACLERTAADLPPVPAFTVATADGQQFSFDGSGSTDPDGRILSYAWDFGDGQAASTPQVSHVFAGFGPRTVTLTVTDNAGGSGLAAQTVQVGSPPPPATTPPAPPTTPPAPPTTPPAPPTTPPPTTTPPPPTTTTTPPTTTTGAGGGPGGTSPTVVAPAALRRLVASAVFGGLGRLGLDGSVRVDRRVRVRVDLLIARTAAVRLRITAAADGGARSAAVILGETVLGAAGPGKAAFRVRLAPAALAGLRRAGPMTVTVRLTLTAPGATPRVLSARRRLRL